MTYTTRYIVYNDPPTLEQLRTWQQDDSSTLQWSFHEAQVVASQLAALPQRQCPSPPPFDPRFEDAESPLEDFNFQSGKVKLVKRALHQPDFGDESDASLPSARSKSRRISHGDGDDSRTEGDTTANVTTCSSIFPPPSQGLSARFFHPSQSQRPTQSFNATRDSCDETYDASGISVGPPPALNWNPRTLVPFDKLHDKLTSVGPKKNSCQVNVLAAVVDVHPSRKAGNSDLTEWDLWDPSSSTVTLSIWGNLGNDWSEEIRRGDIVYLDQVQLKTYQNKLQLSASTQYYSSKLQVCWRSKVVLESDAMYQFNEAWGDMGHATATEVLKVAKAFKSYFKF